MKAIKDKKLSVALVNATPFWCGGVESFELNLYKSICKENFKIDFITPFSVINKGLYDVINEESMVFELKVSENKYISKIQLYFRLRALLYKNKYDIIHINTGSVAILAISSFAAKKSRIKRVIVHSHSALDKSSIGKLFFPILSRLIKNNADTFLSCSENAARSAFHKSIQNDVLNIKNGIISENFRYNSQLRLKTKIEMDLEDAFVIGHVGRFSSEKNQEFLVDILHEVNKVKSNVVLLFIGDGEAEIKKNIIKKATDMNLESKLIFWGTTNTPQTMYQVMDVFLLPSFSEAFPYVLIEAQATGLKCFCSDVITKETNITGNLEFLSLDNKEDWVKGVLALSDGYERTDRCHAIRQNGFDFFLTAKQIEKIYSS